MNDTLKALFRYIKRDGAESTWLAIRDNVLSEIYHPEMRYFDVVKVLLTAYTQALMEPRFEMPGRSNAAEDLLLAPIKGHHSLELAPPASLETRYTIEQFYGAMITKMMGDLQCCRIDWCRHEIWPEVETSTSTTEDPKRQTQHARLEHRDARYVRRV